VTDERRGDVQLSREGDSVTIALSGEIDLATAPRLDAAIREVESGGSTALVVDMSELTFLDSSGLRVLLQASVRARQDGDRLSFIPSTNAAVNRLIEMTGTRELFGA
jgi:anti-sigma B factor antagonist